MNLCARCGVDFTTVSQFDAHPCMMNPEGRPALRDRRRTSYVTIGPDTVHLCDPGCRNEVLADLGIPSSGNGNYQRNGEADVHVAWNRKDYHVTWKPRTSNAQPCDLCADQWRYVAPAARQSGPPTERQLQARAKFAAEHGKSARFRENPAA